MPKWLNAALDYIPRWLQFQLRYHEQPGCALAVAYKSDIVLEAAFGYADLSAGKRMLWGYFLGFIAGIIAFGFWAAIPVFLLAFLRFQAKASWLFSLGLGMGASVLMYFGFERLFRVVLHTGFVTDYVLGLFGG